jgi:hypothetical protein
MGFLSDLVSLPGQIIGGLTGGAGAAESAAQAQLQGTEAATAEQRRQFDITQQNLAPFREAGIAALGQQQALLGLQGQEAFEGATRLSPGQQFLEDRARRNLLRGASAIGGLGGGNIRSALVEQGAGFGAAQLQNQFGQLGQLAGQGQAATTNLGQFGAQTSGNISNLLQAGGQARASGILGAQQASAGLGQQFLGAGLGAAAGGGLLGSGAAGLFGGSAGGGAWLGLLSDERLKTNIKQIGNLTSGLPWYTWEWTEKGAEMAGDQSTEGVMAQEAKVMFPDAVTEVDGFLRVNYKELH